MIQVFSIILLLSIGYIHGINNIPSDIIEVINNEVNKRSSLLKAKDDKKSCTISADKECNISDMPMDQSTMVYPGGETRCIFSGSTPYSYQVIPGKKDKLLVYFQGGGACWDEISTKLRFCSTDVGEQSMVGIFDRENANNYYKDWTIVHLNYCSGDVWGGNTVRPYNDPDGQPVKQVGYINAQSTLDWIKKQQSNGNLNNKLTELVVAGCSAGSVGVQLWGASIIDALQWETAAVIPDSYAGVFPQDIEGDLIKDFGYCDTGLVPPGVQSKCDAGTLLIQDINVEHMKAHPTTPWAFIQAKADHVQLAFYAGVALTTPTNASKVIMPNEFYYDSNQLFSLYNKNPNFLTFLVDGSHHCYTDQSLMYTASTKGARIGDSHMLTDWLNSFMTSDAVKYSKKEIKSKTLSTECAGDIIDGQPDTTPDYCDDGVVPKTFSV